MSPLDRGIYQGKILLQYAWMSRSISGQFLAIWCSGGNHLSLLWHIAHQCHFAVESEFWVMNLPWSGWLHDRWYVAKCPNNDQVQLKEPLRKGDTGKEVVHCDVATYERGKRLEKICQYCARTYTLISVLWCIFTCLYDSTAQLLDNIHFKIPMSLLFWLSTWQFRLLHEVPLHWTSRWFLSHIPQACIAAPYPSLSGCTGDI